MESLFIDQQNSSIWAVESVCFAHYPVWKPFTKKFSAVHHFPDHVLPGEGVGAAGVHSQVPVHPDKGPGQVGDAVDWPELSQIYAVSLVVAVFQLLEDVHHLPGLQRHQIIPHLAALPQGGDLELPVAAALVGESAKSR